MCLLTSKKCKHIHLQTKKKIIIPDVRLVVMTIQKEGRRRQIEKRTIEYSTFKTDDDSYFDWNDKRLHLRGVWNKWRRGKTRWEKDRMLLIHWWQSEFKTAYVGMFYYCCCYMIYMNYRIEWVYYVSTGWVIETFEWKKTYTLTINPMRTAQAYKHAFPVSKSNRNRLHR